MRPYKEHRPTCFDGHIELANREDWLVVPCSRNRDSECVDESNFATALKCFEKCTLSDEAQDKGESDHEVHRFGHWGPGWYELIIVRPGSKTAKEAEGIEAALTDYPILDDSDLSEREMNAANEVWEHCYSQKQRIEYMRDYSEQFEFHSFADMLGCARGKYFAGYASELLSR